MGRFFSFFAKNVKHEKCAALAQIRRPDLFPQASILENQSFCLAYENGHTKAQIRRPKLFPRASILEN